MSAPAMRTDEPNRSRAPGPGPGPAPAPAPGSGAEDRLLAEVMLAHHRIAAAESDDPAADAAARTTDGDLEQRLVVRANAHKHADEFAEAVRHVRHVLWMLVTAGVTLAFIGGAATAQAVMSTARHESINFFLVLGSLLGVQTVLLLIWLGLVLFARGSARASMTAASLGGLLMAMARKIIQWTRHGAAHTAAVSAISTVMMRSPLGKWTVSAISNALWLSFNIGALAVIIALLSAKQYAFVWETTILSSGVYVPLTRTIAWLPEKARFPAPTAEQIARSQFINEEGAASLPAEELEQASRAWSGLLVGSLIVYGFAPRVLLLGWSMSRRRAARSRYRIDPSRPEVIQMRERIEPTAQRLDVIDATDAMPQANSTQGLMASERSREVGPPAIVGVELSHSPEPWPPRLSGGAKWFDLGMVDRREDRERVIRELNESPFVPCALLMVCDLPTTPDRGLGHFLGDVNVAAGAASWLVLTGGQQMRNRGEGSDIAQRVEDWQSLALGVGVPMQRVVELDLDHFTHQTLAKLASMVGADGASETTLRSRRLEQAFGFISDAARRWQDSSLVAISHQEQAALHQQVAGLYRDGESTWRGLLRVPASLGNLASSELAGSVKSSAQHFAMLLPERLKRSPKWLAAGATAGALGCVAAAALISPVAIGSLPMWSAIGAAVAAVMQPAGAKSKDEGAEEPPQLGDAVRAAALLAMVLELQGRNEQSITRVLDAAIPESDAEVVLKNAAQVERWLGEVRHNMDMALAREGRT